MTKSDLHRQRIIVDTAEWQHKLEQLAEMRRTADDGHKYGGTSGLKSADAAAR
jgi:hypothetical protein